MRWDIVPKNAHFITQSALYDGGPLGALLGYAVVGTVVYCLCVSIGEMIAFLYVYSHPSQIFRG